MRCRDRRSLAALKASPFDEAKLATDHFVPRAHVAADVDALDEHARAFANLEDDVDLLLLALAIQPRPDLDERIAESADLVAQLVDRFFDGVGVVPVAIGYR